MRLNHLQISGFKSFPERADLAFDTGVTAIVGPNGCGKSNVIDAITWVLGEQSARSLRGERMEDVIFSGSDARRPTATAEVRLQLSHVTAALAMLGGNSSDSGLRHGNGNSNGGGNGNGSNDHASGIAVEMAVAAHDDVFGDEPTIVRDVEVGRRLFRSGESEYLIDGQVCRLRDIQDLLMDSGVGVKAYAIIEQGKIGQILSARPMERRQLLEEAAGVTKYKSHRRAAELKLEAARQNLTRVDDIVFEVEKQRIALKRQAAKARRYRRLREELRRWEMVHFARRGAALTRAIDAALQRLDDARTREEAAVAQLTGLESAHERLRTDLAEADQAASAIRDESHVHELAVGRLQQRIEFDTQQVVSLTAASTTGETELAALEARRDPLQTELAAQTEAARRCDDEREIAAETLQAAEMAYGTAQAAIEGMEGNVEASRSEVFAAINASTLLRHVLDNAATARGRVDGEIAKLEAEASDVTTESTRLATEREEIEAVVARVGETLERTRLARVDRDAELVSASLQRDAHAEHARVREHDLTSMSARVTSLDEFVTAREGYSDAARLVLAQTKDALDHLGAVADHLDMDREHERAVEAGLGEVLQYVVVRSRGDARAGMDLARAHGTGRCGFLIMDALDVGALGDAVAPAPSLRPFSELVRVAGPAADAIGCLLARLWLAPSFNEAAEAARVTTDPIATPDGTVFRGAAIVHGGGRSETNGILRTKGELRELESRVPSEQAAVQRLQDEVANFSELATRAEAELKTLQTEEHEREKELLEAELNLARCDEERIRLEQRSDVVQTEYRKSEEERDRLEAKRAEASDAISTLEADQRTADDRFMGAQRKLLEARESVDALNERVTEAKTRYAALAERASALGSDVRRLDEAAGDLGQRVSAQAADNQRTLDRQAALNGSIAESQRQLDAAVTQFETLRAQVLELDDRATTLRGGIESQEKTVRGARDTVEGIHTEVGRFEVTKATAEADYSNLSTACFDSLQMPLKQAAVDVAKLEEDGTIARDVEGLAQSEDDAGDDPGDGFGDETVLAAESAGEKDAAAETISVVAPSDAPRPLTAEDVMAQLREKIDHLGPVNMMAIDQFDELEQRFEFLTTQRQDLLDSIKSTGEAIKRIDTTTRERFREAFTAINEHFERTFTTLFGGGRAGLVLLDETDLLDSGVEVIAQPPGKRLQSLQLLSGGEKALTAMALMFAIFRYRPSPFCLLDEIDAPLDEANIGRFVDMLRDMQDHTQFVLVTHNRKTMEIADRLYGVTMEEPGVSKLISVQLN